MLSYNNWLLKDQIIHPRDQHIQSPSVTRPPKPAQALESWKLVQGIRSCNETGLFCATGSLHDRVSGCIQHGAISGPPRFLMSHCRVHNWSQLSPELTAWECLYPDGERCRVQGQPSPVGVKNLARFIHEVSCLNYYLHVIFWVKLLQFAPSSYCSRAIQATLNPHLFAELTGIYNFNWYVIRSQHDQQMSPLQFISHVLQSTSCRLCLNINDRSLCNYNCLLLEQKDWYFK